MAGRRIYPKSFYEWYKGELSKEYYSRTLPTKKDNGMAVCLKPRYTKSQRKKMAERPQIVRFKAVNEEAQRIYHDPVLRAEWEARHVAARREASGTTKYVSPRHWDYIRHELNIAKMAVQKQVHF